MMDIRNTTRSDDYPICPALRTPLQAAPVPRAGQPGGSADGGVEADFDWSSVLGTLGTVARAAAPVIGSALGI